VGSVETGSGGEASVVTVSKAIDRAAATIESAGCEDPRGDAAALIADVLDIGRDELSANGAGELSANVVAAIEAAVERRAEHEPLAYILGREAFRGLEILVDTRVLIPRRETGLLVEAALDLPEGAHVHEVGTGSGAVALALLGERPDLLVTASDLSLEAAEVARANAKRLDMDLRVMVAKGLPREFAEGVDMVLANVTDSTIFERSPEIRHEPRIAVTGDCGEDGLGVIRGLVAETPSGMRMALEHDTHHGPAMREILRDATTMRDYMGGERVTVGTAP
jgi:release factor glutamine methyltransferase